MRISPIIMIHQFSIKMLSPRYLKPVFMVAFVILLSYGCSHFLPGEKQAPSTKEMAPSVTEDKVRDAYNYFTLASLALTNGEYNKAQEYLSIAIEKDPESAFLHLRMAMLLKGMKDFNGAISHAAKCVELEPQNTSHLLLLADLYTMTGQDDLALEQYNKALALDPGNQRIRLILATFQIKKGQFKEALSIIDKMIEQDPESIIARYYRGKVELELKNYQAAEKSLLEVLRLKEGHESTMFDLGMLYQLTNRKKDAVRMFERLLNYNPENMSARVRLVQLYRKLGLTNKADQQISQIKENAQPGEAGRQSLGLIYLGQGKVDEAIEELNLILSIWPEDQKSRYYLGMAYHEKGDLEKALENFYQITEGSKYFIDTQMHIAFILDTQKLHQKAISILRKAISLNNERPEIYLMLASIYENLQQYDKAISVVKEGMNILKDDIDLMFRLGVLLDKTGDKTACLEQMNRILEINPDHADSLNYIGYTYAEQGVRLDEAMEMVKRALEIKPDSGYIIDSLGWIYFQKGQYDEAVTYLKKSSELTPDDPTINEHLGDAYLKKMEYENALKYYKKALSSEHPSPEKLKEKISEVRRLMGVKR
ncbi:Tetratricopeptide repeat protein [uncultured Desulfobacterium sp.]|uniref:Tetratricopeptide repeat protein n=1 Tax=uncultured Desulfobacterium sp. TaxID=201089 RepID=A0A445MWW9_9BACT|nr:Tetratricopeptide repeat protein [uncultured Desulfobacterium sp.]